MSKRDHDTEIWSEDWFMELGSTNQLFWFYIKDRCDHAGFWRPNFKQFEIITGHRVNQKEFLEKCNADKVRILVLECGKWWLTGFIAFHFRGVLNLSNRFHKSVFDIFSKNITCENTNIYGFEIKVTSLRPHTEQEQGTSNSLIKLKEGESGEKKTIIPDHLKEPMMAFIEHRKKNKKIMTEKAIELSIIKVQKLYPDNPEKQIASIYNSIERGWQGIFKLEENNVSAGRERNSEPGLSKSCRPNNVKRPGYDQNGRALGAAAKPGEFGEKIITLEGVPDHR
jgi:hypothetical protein